MACIYLGSRSKTLARTEQSWHKALVHWLKVPNKFADAPVFNPHLMFLHQFPTSASPRPGEARICVAKVEFT